MEKKRSVGVTIISWILILQGINAITQGVKVGMFPVILGACSLAAGIGLLKLLKQARIGAIALYIFATVYTLFQTIVLSRQYGFQYPGSMITGKAMSLFIISGLFLVILIIFFTRPKVKEQFR